MKIRLTLISILIGLSVFGQDVNFGINFGTNPYNRLVLKGDIYQPVNSFYSYTSEKKGSGFVIDEHKLFNTITFGASARISRKKIGLNIDPQFLFEYIRFNFKSPYQSKRVMSRRGFRLPIYFTYHLFNNPESIHINAGFILSGEINYDYQVTGVSYYFSEEEPFETNLDYSQDHFKGVFYSGDGKPNFQYMVGFGKRINKLDYNLRYVTNLGSKLQGSRWQVEMSILFYFISKEEFSTKNYLYEE
ncbi:MAG: hypothetical protein AB8B74_11435 [Crocinitomicaceae bacterium]